MGSTIHEREIRHETYKSVQKKEEILRKLFEPQSGWSDAFDADSITKVWPRRSEVQFTYWRPVKASHSLPQSFWRRLTQWAAQRPAHSTMAWQPRPEPVLRSKQGYPPWYNTVIRIKRGFSTWSLVQAWCQQQWQSELWTGEVPSKKDTTPPGAFLVAVATPLLQMTV